MDGPHETRTYAIGLASAGYPSWIDALVYQGTREFIDSTRAVAHSQNVLRHLNLAGAGLLEAESSARGYVIARREHHHSDYKRALGP